MNHTHRHSLKSSIGLAGRIASGLAVLSLAAVSAFGQSGTEPGFVVDDWSHHHLVFSNPENLPDAARDKIVNDPRYRLQQRKSGFARPAVAAEPGYAGPMREILGNREGSVKKDWSTPLGGVAASLTGVVGALSSSTIGSNSTLTVDSVALNASAPAGASATGTFTGNPTNGQTVTIGGSVVLTSSLSTPAAGSISVGSSFCIAPGQGIVVNGTTLTTNATAGTGSFVVATVPSAGETVTIAGVIYTFETTLSGSTPLNQVLTPNGNNAANQTATARNLAVAINNSGTCGSTSGGVCTKNVSTANPAVSSTNNSSATQTLTALCGDNAQIANISDGSKVTVNTVAAASSAGTNSATTFALNTSGSTPASQSLTATNMVTAINTNTTTKAFVTATSGATGVVTLTANTWGTVGNGYTLAESATSGVTVSGTTMSGGANGTNTGTSFAIDNVAADAATSLAAAIARNGGTVGVTATSAGAVVTVTAVAPGTGGNSVTLAESLSNFTWSGSALGGGSDGTNSSTTFAYWSGSSYLTPAQVAANIAAAVNANTTLQGGTGVSAAASGADVIFTAQVTGTAANGYTVSPGSFAAFTGGTLSGGAAAKAGGAVQPNAYPAKFSFSATTANCSSDFVVYPTGVAGATGSANIIAYNNVYASGCSGVVPSVYWAYNTGTGDAVTTSPIISFDGTGSQVAFIQSNGATASLVLLKWAASTSGTLANSASASAYRSCTAPCMYTMALSGNHNDTLSSPFYYYNGDVLYVGDDSGNLHQFTGVFSGTPAENTGSAWPVNLGSGGLSSPVYDPNWAPGGQIYVGDLGGALHCVTASTGAIFGTKTGLGEIPDAPLIDSSANYVIVFTDFASGYADAVYGFSEQFFPGGEGGPVLVGTGALGYYLYAGAFDNVYYQSSNHTGSLYVVGNSGATNGGALYQVGLSGGFLTAGVTAVVLGLTPNSANAYPWPSPLTEFCNPGTKSACALNTGGTATTTGTDYVFFSVNRGDKGGCTNTAGSGCILSYDVSTPTAVAIAGSGLNITTPGTNGCWATGGIVIDNGVPATTLAGASQIYFVNLNGNAAGNPSAPTSANCTSGAAATIDAVQASQSSP